MPGGAMMLAPESPTLRGDTKIVGRGGVLDLEGNASHALLPPQARYT